MQTKNNNMKQRMQYNPGFEIYPSERPLGFLYGKDVFGPKVENRSLDSIRKSLMDPECDGPDTVYSIAMDVGKLKDRGTLKKLHLLYGAVTYSAGKLGREPVRSQGHIHIESPCSGWSTPEVYEIWEGKAVIYMQEYAEDNPGRCFAVEAGAGDVVIVPPYWAHATINADPTRNMTFGAWCDRGYGFDYKGVRAHNGIAWFPVFDNDGKLSWIRNKKYKESVLNIKSPSDYSTLSVIKGKSIYSIFEKDNHAFDYVPHPELKKDVWKTFEP